MSYCAFYLLTNKQYKNCKLTNKKSKINKLTNKKSNIKKIFIIISKLFICIFNLLGLVYTIIKYITNRIYKTYIEYKIKINKFSNLLDKFILGVLEKLV